MADDIMMSLGISGALSGAGEYPSTGGYESGVGGLSATGIVGFITGGLDAVKNALAKTRATMVKAIADYATTPLRAGVVLVSALAVSIALGALYEYLKTFAEVKALVAFIEGIANTIAVLGSFFQVDIMITLMQLGYEFLPEFHKNMAKIYESLGALSSELSKDVSFITVFTESARAILHAGYALTNNGFILAELKFAEGMSNWLGGVRDRLEKYVDDPSLIFTDIQKAIATAAKDETDKQLAKIWSGLDFVKEGIRKSGDEIIELLNALDKIQKDSPQEIQDAIKVWYEPFRKDFDKFLDEKWNPFWESTNKAFDIITQLFTAHDISIKELEAKIKSPSDLFKALFLLPENESKAAINDTRVTLYRVLYGDYLTTGDITKEYLQRITEVDMITKFPPVESPSNMYGVGMLPEPSIEPMTETSSWFRGEE